MKRHSGQRFIMIYHKEAHEAQEAEELQSLFAALVPLYGQNLNGFLSILPVFLSIEPTFESSFFVSAGLTAAGCAAFFAGVVAFLSDLAAGAGSAAGG